MLGGFRVSVGAGKTVERGEWRLKKAAGLVKILALAAGHRIHRERAMDLLWPEMGAAAASNNLRQTLYAARKALDSDSKVASGYVSSKDEMLALCPEGNLWVDAEAFEAAAAAARRTRDPAIYRAAHLADLLLARSDEFREVWNDHEVGIRPNEVKHFIHPELGALELTCQTLLDPSQSHSLLVYTAIPGSESYEKLQLLSVIGAQALR